MVFRIVYGADGPKIKTEENKIVRENKGESLVESLQDFVSIDLETTGLSPVYDEIIEFGAMRYRDGEPVAAFTQLVKPVNPIDEFVEDLTGITNEMLSDAPSISAALPSFLEFVADDVLIGHNIHFDVNFIYDNCEKLGLPPFTNSFIDTMRIARRLHPDWSNHKLDTLLKNLGLDSRGLHRAENDASLTAEAYLKLTSDPGFAEIKKLYKSYDLKASDIVPTDPSKAKEDSPLYNKVCVFTGALESFTRREAMQLVVDLGGAVGDSVTKKTNYLVLGNNDYCTTIKDGKSSKQKKAEKLILEGADLQIIPESVFLDMLK